jgi:hypothetical protein
MCAPLFYPGKISIFVRIGSALPGIDAISTFANFGKMLKNCFDRAIFSILVRERLDNELPLYPFSFTATLPIFFIAMPHIAPQKIVDWQQNSGG